METKQSLSPALLIAGIAILLGVVGVIAFRSFGTRDNGSAPGGTAARTVAPVVQRYPDGSVVPYNAAPAGAIPGDPSSIRR